MNKKLAAGILAAFVTLTVGAQKDYKYRISLKDKATTSYSLDKPEQYLSEKALARRAKQGLKVDSTDLPVCESYVEAIRERGVEIITTGKWNNTVTIQCKDTTLIDGIAALPFVKETEKVWSAPDSIPARNPKRLKEITDKLDTTKDFYGSAHRQITIHKGDSLHAAGFRGEGMTIAIIDGGYYNVDGMKALKSVNILGTKDFVNPNSDIYAENTHGMTVLSCMATNQPYAIVGTAPAAAYWLLRSEDVDTESLVEQDYWAAAIEFADSVGVDVVNTSLGYRDFDDKSKNYQYKNLDGKYSLMSRSAGMAADKGIVVVCSAGNEGTKSWKNITPPADAFNVITVAAIGASLVNAPFSSVGYTTDGRIKPDVAAIGLASAVIGADGSTSRANGTSFASPIMCGLVTCVWQACPKLTAKQLIEVIKKSGDRVNNPDNIYGYGIPDVYSAYKEVNGIK